MGMRFTDTTVTIGATTYNTFNPDARTTGPCAWSPAIINWGYSDSLAQPEPSTLSLPVTIPDGHPLPQYGERVIVTTRYESYVDFGDGPVVSFTSEPFVQFTGEVDGANRTRATLTTAVEERGGAPRVEGWGINLTAAGDFARLGRTPLADNPWPEENAADRVRRIAPLVPRVDFGADASNLIGTTGMNYPVRARDVDNFNALEAILLTTTAESDLLFEGYPGPRLISLEVLPQLLRLAAGGPAWIERYDDNPNDTYWLWAGCLEDGSRDLNVASVVNVASTRYPVRPTTPDEDYTDTTFSVRDPGSTTLYGESEWRTTTDVLDAPDIMAFRLRRAVAARAAEQWTIPTPSRVLLDELSGPYGYRLLPSHPGLPIRLSDTPPDIDPFQRVIGGTLTLHGDYRAQELEVTLEPARNAASRTLPIDYLEDFPINTLTAVTIADFNDVSNAQVI